MGNKIELALSVEDFPEDMQKSEGDIIDVKSYPYNWGLDEIDTHLIVIVDIGLLQWNIVRGKLISYKYTIEGDTESGAIAKRAYSIPLANLRTNHLTDLDLTKVRDITAKYQPFKSAAQLVSQFDGTDGRYSLTTSDVDCSAGLTPPDTEVTINWANNLVYDKYAGKYMVSL